jgi:hypothetical protein
MSESIAEMVIPGTYIEVRAEGLIGVGGIVTGNIGIVGTAGRGPVGEVRTLSSLADAIDLFGLEDSLTSPHLADHPLTLVRTLRQAFEGGARNVLAVRAANGDATPATLDIASADGKGFTLSAKGSGGDGSSGTWGRDLTVKVVVDATAPDVCQLTVSYRKRSEVYAGANTEAVFNAIAASPFVTASGLDHGTALLTPMPATPLAGGTDGADVAVSDGMSAKKIGNVVQGHVARTLNEGRERIAILGADAPGTSTDAATLIDDADTLENDRVVLVAPGLRTADGTLPPSYLAAVVAGKLSTLAPHVSLTNKSLPATVDVRYSSGVVSTLLGKQVLVVRQKYGTQVVRGLTTSAPPFSQISVRRTVDYAKAGVRLGSDPYIGRLNNARVRAALQATLDGFLSQMVLDEMLIGYDLSVTATRAQEIAGVCSVVMNLKPTFSIDFIRVTMNLE